jgi:hypothetical protein
MTDQERANRLAYLLDMAIEYIEAIADKDSETLAYLVEQYQEIAQ